VTSSDSNLAAIYVPITAANALVSATEVARHRERRAPSSDSGPVAKSHTGDGRRHGATTLRSETRAATADWRGFVESHVPSVAAQPTLIDEIARRMAADAEQGRLVRLPEGLQ
jgi:hypothetical protein